MALVKCPECGREKVSDSAESCPNCGYAIKVYYDKLRQEEELRLLYTFSPKVNTSTSFSKKKAIEYNNNVSPLMKENGGQNVRKSNPFDRLYKNSGIKAKKSNSLQFSSFSKLDNKKKRPKTSKRGHEKLYKDYKEYENKKKNLQKEIDMERGITFKPKCTQGS